jgi:hypothetical protein
MQVVKDLSSGAIEKKSCPKKFQKNLSNDAPQKNILNKIFQRNPSSDALKNKCQKSYFAPPIFIMGP